MNNVALEVKNLRKVFKNGDIETEVLKSINLVVEKEDFISLMGESGSGKSTLLYQMGGIDKPTEGEVIINGKSLNNMTDKEKAKMRRENIGFVFQFYNLIPNLNVEDNILLPVIVDNKKVSDYTNRLEKLLDIVGLSDKRKSLPRQLSGGEQQRVAIARAIIMSPDIILADEPTGNLDAKTTKEIMELFKKINDEEKITIIQVTHSKDAASYGKKIIKLEDGMIIE